MEVAKWTGFHESFTHASSNQPSKDERRSIVIAALMAMSTNNGLTKMADAIPDISYVRNKRMKHSTYLTFRIGTYRFSWRI